MGWLVVAGTLLLFLWIGAHSLRRLMLVTVAMAPWQDLAFEGGLRITAYLLALLALVMLLALRVTQPGWRPKPPPAGAGLALLLLFAIVASLTQLAFLPEMRIGEGLGRSPNVRAVTQILLFLLAASPALAVPWLLTRREDVTAMARAHVMSVLILAAVGWVQIVIWYGTGFNPFPTNGFSAALGGSLEARAGTELIERLNIYRMNSLAGEPRALGGSLMVVMLIIQARSLAAGRMARRDPWIWLFCLASLAMTISTSAIVLWTLGTAVQLVAPLFIGWRPKVSLSGLARVGLVLVAPVFLAGFAAEAAGIPVGDILAARTVERLSDNGAVEDFDLAIIDYFTAHPDHAVFGVGLGNIHLYATPYLQPEFAAYAEGHVFTAKQQWLRYVSELGIAGLALLVGWYAALMLTLAAACRRSGPQEPFAMLIPLGFANAAIFLASGGTAPEFMLMTGALAAAIAVLRREAAVR